MSMKKGNYSFPRDPQQLNKRCFPLGLNIYSLDHKDYDFNKRTLKISTNNAMLFLIMEWFCPKYNYRTY